MILLSLRSSPQTQRYIYKRVMVHAQAIAITLSQIRYSLVVILELNGGSEVQHKDMMMVDNGKYQ